MIYIHDTKPRVAFRYTMIFSSYDSLIKFLEAEPRGIGGQTYKQTSEYFDVSE